MMNDDDLHLNKSSDHYNYSMQNINSTNDDSCIDLLEIIKKDDNTSNIAINDGGEMKENDTTYQEIMSALEKKDFSRIASLALSQSQGGQKMGMILNETMSALEKSSSKTVDSNIIEKLTSIIRAQPKNNSLVLRATVAPIRNESIVSSSSTSIGNYTMVPNNPGPKSSSQVTRYTGGQDMSEHDWNALFSPATPPTTPAMSFVQFNGPGMMHGGYGGVQYQPGFISNNGIVCIVTPTNGGGGGGTDHVTQQQMQQQVQQQQQVQLQHHQQQQQHPFMLVSSSSINQPCPASVSVTCPMTMDNISNKPSAMVSSGVGIGGSNLPRILPRPGNRVIAPKTQYTQQYMNVQSTVTGNNNNHNNNQQQQQQASFKRPPSTSRSRASTGTSGQRSSSKNGGGGGGKTGRGSKAKDNIMMAWEIAEQSLGCDDHVNNTVMTQQQQQQQHNSSFMTQLETDGMDHMIGINNYDPINDLHQHHQHVTDHMTMVATTNSNSASTNNINHIFDHVTMTGTDAINNDCYDHVTVSDTTTTGTANDSYDRMNIFAGLEDLMEGLNETLHAPVIMEMPGSSESLWCLSMIDVVVQRHTVTVQRSPLSRACVTMTPVSCNAASVTVQCTQSSPLQSSSHHHVTEDENRMVQLLYAHLGRHSDLIGSSWFKCLQQPLSVSTRMSEHDDLMTEEEYSVADISPVKRDPVHLANLDRLLQLESSYQSGPLPAQTRVPFHNGDDSTLQSFIGGTNSPHKLWLRRGHKHKNKWTKNGTMLGQVSRALEVPPSRSVSTDCCSASNTTNIATTTMSLLRKKSNHSLTARLTAQHKQDNRDKKMMSRNRAVAMSERYKQRMSDIRQDNARRRGESSGLLKIRIQLSKAQDVVAVDTKHEPRREPVLDLRHESIVEPLLDLRQEPIHEIVMELRNEPRREPKHEPVLNPKLEPVQVLRAKTKTKTRLDGSSTKRIFCTRKEDRRSSVLQTHIQTSPIKTNRKKKKKKQKIKNPRLIMKLCSKRSEMTPQTSESIKLLIRRSGESTYKSVISAVGQHEDEQQQGKEKHGKERDKERQEVVVEEEEQEEEEEDDEDEKHSYQYSPAVNLAPPPSSMLHAHRSRPQQAVLQFSPAHSSTDSDMIGVAHNEISSLLQRQEQREPLTETGINQTATFPSLPVPYLIGTDPSVFMDPHEVELVVVKNSRYKKVTGQQRALHTLHIEHSTLPAPGHTVFGDTSNSTDMFVPGCFVDQDKSGIAWHHRSSPSMPVLAPQEPFLAAAASGDTAANKVSHTTVSSHVPCPYSQASSGNHQSQSFSEQQQSQQAQAQSDHNMQQSPLCMATNGHNHNNSQSQSQYPSSSTQIDLLMPPDAIKSPLSYHRHSNYHYQPTYNTSSSCYLNESTNQSLLQQQQQQQSSSSSSASKTQPSLLSPAIQLQTSVTNSAQQCNNSQLSSDNYSYFHNNAGQHSLQSLAATDSSLFAPPCSSYQSIPDLSSQPSAKSSSKRSSASRTHGCDQSSSSSKKRKDAASSSAASLAAAASLPVAQLAPQLPTSLSMYSNNSDLYNAAAAAAHYSGLDYYGSGFSNILGNMDQMKLYEQYAREYTLQLGSFCPPTMPWSNAMAEYCKQTVGLPSSSSLSGAGVAASSPNPLLQSSLSSASSASIHNSLGGPSNTDYSNSYTAYAMSQPYSMYSSFGMPK